MKIHVLYIQLKTACVIFSDKLNSIMFASQTMHAAHDRSTDNVSLMIEKDK